MFVFNDCRTDSRVLREAGTLVQAGHDVTIVARPTDAASSVSEREERDGFTILRVPIPPGYRYFRLWLKYPWRIVSWSRERAGRGMGRLPGGLTDLAVAAGALIVSAPLSMVRGPFYLLAGHRIRARARTTGPVPDPVLPESVATRVGSAPQAPATAQARAVSPRKATPFEWLQRWRWVIGAWARSAAAAAGPADVYHGHDLTGLVAAIDAVRRHPSASVVYDSHEIYLESGANAEQPGWVRRVMSRRERRWIERCAALVTVNESLARELGARYAPKRTVVVHNCPARSDAPERTTDLLRAAAGIPAESPVALYHGALFRHRGLEQLVAAVAEPGLDGVHAVFLGYGGMRAELEHLAATSPVSERIHVLPAVPPEELASWVATADVGVIAIQPSTLNHRMSTPNKLFECLAAGVPVVASDFPEMRKIVCEDPLGKLGQVVTPDDVTMIASAIRTIVSAPPGERAELRARCLQAAHERWNWESETAGLVRLYADLELASASQP